MTKCTTCNGVGLVRANYTNSAGEYVFHKEACPDCERRHHKLMRDFWSYCLFNMEITKALCNRGYSQDEIYSALFSKFDIDRLLPSVKSKIRIFNHLGRVFVKKIIKKVNRESAWNLRTVAAKSTKDILRQRNRTDIKHRHIFGDTKRVAFSVRRSGKIRRNLHTTSARALSD